MSSWVDRITPELDRPSGPPPVSAIVFFAVLLEAESSLVHFLLRWSNCDVSCQHLGLQRRDQRHRELTALPVRHKNSQIGPKTFPPLTNRCLYKIPSNRA